MNLSIRNYQSKVPPISFSSNLNATIHDEIADYSLTFTVKAATMTIMYCKHPSSLLACIIIFAKRGETGILERVLPSAVTIATAPSKVRPREMEVTEGNTMSSKKLKKTAWVHKNCSLWKINFATRLSLAGH